MLRTILVGALLLAGCADTFDVDLGEFMRLPEIAQLDFSRIAPAASYQYWELRYQFEGTVPTILGSGGTRTRDQLDPALRSALDTTRTPSGFAIGCLPGYCYKYIVAVDGGIRVFATRQALADFLGSINSMEEAALLAHAQGLHWTSLNAATGYRETGAGWEIVGLQLVRDCTPVQTDRVLLLVRRDGSIRELDREVYQRTENACV